MEGTPPQVQQASPSCNHLVLGTRDQSRQMMSSGSPGSGVQVSWGLPAGPVSPGWSGHQLQDENRLGSRGLLTSACCAMVLASTA